MLGNGDLIVCGQSQLRKVGFRVYSHYAQSAEDHDEAEYTSDKKELVSVHEHPSAAKGLGVQQQSQGTVC